MSNSGSLHIGGSSGDGSNPPKKRVRQESKGINVKKWIKKAQGPLKVDFDEETGKSYGRNGKAFNNMIGQQVRDGLSPRFTCWNDVPKEDKALVLDQLELQFVYDRTDVIIMDEIDRLAAKAFREWRYCWRRHWKKLGGEKDNDAARKNPPKKIKDVDWKFLCDYFGSEGQIKTSKQNSANRSIMPFDSCHGSRSILSYLKEGENSETHDLPSLVDNFKDMHWRPSKGWTNETANTTYDEMIKMRASRLTQSANTDESVGSVPSPDALTDDQIVDIVRGTRSRYKKGKGTLPRLKAIRGTRAHNSSSDSAFAREQAETIATLQRQITKQSEEQEKSQKTITSLIQALKEHIPNFNIQPSSQSS